MSKTVNNLKSPSSAFAVLRQNNVQKHHYMFEDKVIIGRSPLAFVCIAESYISRKHCIIEKTEDNKFTICDMSTSGTFVNDKRLIKNKVQELNHLDRIKLADNDAYSYLFLINKKRFGVATAQRMRTDSPLAKKMNDLNETQYFEKENIDKELDFVGSEMLRLKEELQKAREEKRKEERSKLEMESAYNKEQADQFKKKLSEVSLEKEQLMLEYEKRIAENADKAEELKKAKSEIEKRHSAEREELERKCKAEIEELKKKLEKSEAQSQQVEELQSKLEEVKNALLESELEQQRLFDAKIEVETKLETKIVDLTNDAQKVKELELKLKEKEGLEEKVKKEMEGLEDDIMCSICAEIYIEPTALNCGHMFCKLCITEWSKKKKICPMCRAKILTTVRIFNMDSVIQRNIRLMSEEAQSRREELIRERTKGKTPQKKKPSKKRTHGNSFANRQPSPPSVAARRLRLVHVDLPEIVRDNPRQNVPGGQLVIPIAPRHQESEGDDPFAVGWVRNQHNVDRSTRTSSPVTVAAVDLTNITFESPARPIPRLLNHTVTSADNTTIDLTDL